MHFAKLLVLLAGVTILMVYFLTASRSCCRSSICDRSSGCQVKKVG